MGARSDLAQCYYDIATLLDAGVPILRSIDILIQGRRGRLRRVFSQMRASLSQGSTLGESMDQHRHVFPEMDRMLIQAAETAGSLGDSFKTLSQWHEFVNKITWRMIWGMVYPVSMLHAAAFILPGVWLILHQVDSRGYALWVARILSIVYIPLLVVLATSYFKSRTSLLRRSLDWLVLVIPVLGQAIYHMSVSRYARAFAMLYKAGVPISECTQRAQRATGNAVVASRFAGATVSVREGNMVSDGLSSRLPAEYRDLWRIGEETGELDKMADKVAEISANRADMFFNAFASGFPKVVYFVILGIMAAMVLSIARQFYGNLYSSFNF